MVPTLPTWEQLCYIEEQRRMVLKHAKLSDIHLVLSKKCIKPLIFDSSCLLVLLTYARSHRWAAILATHFLRPLAWNGTAGSRG